MNRFFKSKDYRQNRFHGKDDTRHEDLEAAAEWFTQELPGAKGTTLYYALAYSGKRSDPDFHYAFRTEEQRAAYIASWLAGLKMHAASKAAARTAAKELSTTLKVGDILNGSWGYDQTNQEWWEVTKVIGAKTVEVRPLCADSVSIGIDQYRETPVPHQFTKEPAEIKRVQCHASGDYLSFECFTLSTFNSMAILSWVSPCVRRSQTLTSRSLRISFITPPV